MRKPVIGMTAITAFDEENHAQRRSYSQAILNAGGEPILLPSSRDTSNCRQLAALLDGLLVPGGPDIDPALYGEEMREACGEFCRYEDEYDMELIREAVHQKKPILAICRGMQIINVLYGGTLYQDIPAEYSEEMIHTRITKGIENFHTATLEKESYLANILGEWEQIKVNSSHHQAVKRVAEGFRVTGYAPDGTIEAMENADASILCVQWHPERLQDMEMYRRLFQDYIARVRRCMLP